MPTVLAEPASLEVTPPGQQGRAADPALMRTWRDWLMQQGIAVDRCGFDSARGTLVVDIENDAQRQQMLDVGFTLVREYNLAPLQGGPRTQSEYFDPGEIAAMLTQIAADHPAITRHFTIGTTTQGRLIHALEISNNPAVAEDEPAIQFNGQHHAREVATSHVVMDIVETLTTGYGVDPLITGWVNAYKTVCVPMVNPDGVQYVFSTNSLWRRNRMVYPTCTGVDNNRNYPYLWGPGCGSSGSCNDTYRGPSSASELETQAMIALAAQFPFVMATSYHSFGQFIDYPYACSNGSPSQQMPEHAVIDEMMHGVADGIFAVDGTAYDVNSPIPAGGVNGDDTSWYYAARGVYSFIIEVGTSFEPPFAQVAGIINHNRGGWKYMYDRLGKARIDVHVRDACTNQPMQAQVTLTNYVFDTGESPRTTSPPFGRWTFMIPPNGSYTVRAAQSGYVTQDVVVSVGTAPTSVNIELEPVNPPPGGCVSAIIPTTSQWGAAVMAILIIGAAKVLLTAKPRPTPQ